MFPDEIENGQFRAIGKPSEGIRQIYLPKDSNDFNFYPVNTVDSGNNGARVTATGSS